MARAGETSPPHPADNPSEPDGLLESSERMPIAETWPVSLRRWGPLGRAAHRAASCPVLPLPVGEGWGEGALPRPPMDLTRIGGRPECGGPSGPNGSPDGVTSETDVYDGVQGRNGRIAPVV